MHKSGIKKNISILIIMIFIISIMPVIYAANMTVKATVDLNKNVKISGSISLGSGAAITAIITDPLGKISYIADTVSSTGGLFEICYSLPDTATEGVYTVYVKGTQVDGTVKTKFTYKQATGPISSSTPAPTPSPISSPTPIPTVIPTPSATPMQSAMPTSINVTCNANEEFDIAVVLNEGTTNSDEILEISYDSNKIYINDLCVTNIAIDNVVVSSEFTAIPNSNALYIASTGMLKMKFEPNNVSLSGVIHIIRFKSKENGSSTISMTRTGV